MWYQFGIARARLLTKHDLRAFENISKKFYAMSEEAAFPIDLHAYRSADIDVEDLLRQAWEMGVSKVQFIHGHGRNRPGPRYFVNSNTGPLGRHVRASIRNNSDLKRIVKISTLDCSHAGWTSVGLRKNSHPTRSEIAMPETSF